MGKVTKYKNIVGYGQRGWGEWGGIFVDNLGYYIPEDGMIFKTRKMAEAVYGKDYVVHITLKIEVRHDRIKTWK